MWPRWNCALVLSGGWGGWGGVGSLVKCPVTSVCRVLSLEQGIKFSRGHRVPSYPGERDLGPCLASIFQMGTKAADLLELGLPAASGLASLTPFAGPQIQCQRPKPTLLGLGTAPEGEAWG